MRIMLTGLLFVLAAFASACQTTDTPATRPGVATPPGPMDTVTNPMNQPRIERTGALH